MRLNRRGFLTAATLSGAVETLTPGLLGHSTAAQSTTELPQDSAETSTPEPLVIAAVSAPVSLDPGMAADMESQRIVRQVFEPLVGIDQDTGAPEPLLAQEWETSEDGRLCTLTLRQDVTFQDGSLLNAETVVENFHRWGQLDQLYEDEQISRTVPLTFPSVFGGFLEEDSCVLESVEAPDEHTVELHLKEPVAHLLQALTLPSFGIASAAVLSDSDPSLISRNPVGTGAYQVISQGDGETLLERFEDYWGAESQGPQQVMVRAVTRSFDRLRELQRGRVDIYDCVTADSLRSLVQSGRLILPRDPFSLLYLGFNMDHPVMADAQIREAAALAINRRSLAQSVFLEGTQAAYQFTPPSLGVQSEEATRYDYAPEDAVELLSESDYDGEPLDFYYPIAATRSYLPQPEAIFAALAADLTAAGFTVRPRPIVWEDGYVDELMADENRAMHLLGRNGGYRSAHSFLGSLFGQRSAEFNYDVDDIRELLDEARSEQDNESRTELYQQAAELLAEDLPALPLAYPISSLALGDRVSSYPMSPVLNELFSDIRLTDNE